jgi:hypothetical protein
MRNVFNDKKFAVYSDCQDSSILGSRPIDLHKALRSKDLSTSGDRIVATDTLTANVLGNNLDLPNWLPFAAKSYNISASIEDYLLIPFIIMPSDLPNRNCVAFPLRELVKWAPECGRQAYQTWKGMPTFLEHDNSDHTKAYGAIADVSLRKMEGFGQGKVWKVLSLYALDRTKHPDIAVQVLSGELNSSSMGAFVDRYSCSYCNAELGKCTHISTRRSHDFYELEGKLVFRNVHNPRGFELSLVHTPAYLSAISDVHLKI